MESYSAAQIKEFQEWGVPLPTRAAHGNADEIRSQLERARPVNWRQVGNKLMCDTQFGPLVQFIPTDLLLTGTDADGLPVLQKILL